jgi:uncharacterized protein with NRDE domain
MCTVSFIPLKDRIIITSNRDESIDRNAAELPRWHQLKNQKLFFPKDGGAGGSWITISENGYTGVLLNGAFEKHVRKEVYKKSRGIALLDVMQAQNPLHAFHNYNLQGIEPFTLILWQKGDLYECHWDEYSAYINFLDSKSGCLWSSPTLYNSEIQIKKENKFNYWLNQNENVTIKDVIDFHKTMLYESEEMPDKEFESQIKTLSISSIIMNNQTTSFIYLDQLQEKIHEMVIN